MTVLNLPNRNFLDCDKCRRAAVVRLHRAYLCLLSGQVMAVVLYKGPVGCAISRSFQLSSIRAALRNGCNICYGKVRAYSIEESTDIVFSHTYDGDLGATLYRLTQLGGDLISDHASTMSTAWQARSSPRSTVRHSSQRPLQTAKTPQCLPGRCGRQTQQQRTV